MFRDITVLMSASSSPSMPGMIKCLRNNGERNIKVVGIDMTTDPSAKFMVDVFYQVPAASDSKFCDVVLDICKKEKVDVYFPNVSAEVEAVNASNRICLINSPLNNSGAPTCAFVHISTYTLLPFAISLAIVAPHPRISSSACGAIINMFFIISLSNSHVLH